MSYYLGIDLGTTFFKAGVFDAEGRMLGLGRAAVAKNEDGIRCELPVDAFWRLLKDVIAQALGTAAMQPRDITALAYSSQANSFLLLDASGAPLTPLILWPDRRAAEMAEWRGDPWQRNDFLQVTGVGLKSPEFAACKLAWFQHERPELWRQTEMIQSISDYLVFTLTGRRMGDLSTAALLGLVDQRRGVWWGEALRGLGVMPEWMSRLLRPGTPAGALCPAGAAQIGLSPAARLVVGGLDHYIAALGAGLGALAECSESTGTVLACIALNHRFGPRHHCCIGPSREPGRFYELVFNDCGAASLDWYRDRFAPGVPIAELIGLAAKIPPGCEGLRARPVLAGCTSREAAFEGIHDRHTAAHFVRAILEANARALAGLIGELGSGRRPPRILATGGGARSDLWLQLKADLLGIEIVQVGCEEPACQGAAWLAARGSGSQGHAYAQPWCRVKHRFTPRAGLTCETPQAPQ